MLTNLRGRVESDPMGVPAPATMAGRGGTFDSLLQQVVDAQQPTAVEPVPAPTEPAQAPAEPPPVEDQAAENPPEDQPEAVAEVLELIAIRL